MNADTQLQHAVLAELEREPSVEASRIGVTAEAGVVTLTGSVATLAEKVAAEQAAKRVHGVRAIANDIELHIPGSRQWTDADIASAALAALQRENDVPEDRIKVVVRRGWITLAGTVACQCQREAAEEAVSDLTGVSGVTNQITLQCQGKPGEQSRPHSDEEANHVATNFIRAPG
jgi:osmotically-inducible protein OsmY